MASMLPEEPIRVPSGILIDSAHPADQRRNHSGLLPVPAAIEVPQDSLRKSISICCRLLVASKTVVPLEQSEACAG
ncbi:unnamed protein product [Victoria cruziana]